MDFLNAAFHLTQFGFKVFPLLQWSKAPACKNGVKEATDDENIIAGWARRYPRANIGLACGAISGVVAIDLDPRNGSDESIAKLAARKQDFTPTVSVRTANGGYHLYYAYEPGLKNSKSVLAQGIDFKTDFGYVVAPPSVLEGGKMYTWTNSPLGGDLPKMPRWALEALKPRPKLTLVSSSSGPATGDTAPLVKFVKEANDGERNNKLFWAACRAASSGQLSARVQAEFLEAAVEAGLEQDKAAKTVQSAMRRGKLQ